MFPLKHLLIIISVTDVIKNYEVQVKEISHIPKWSFGWTSVQYDWIQQNCPLVTCILTMKMQYNS